MHRVKDGNKITLNFVFIIMHIFSIYFQPKCEQYWPETKTEEQYGKLKVKLVNTEKFADFLINELQLTHKVGHITLTIT